METPNWLSKANIKITLDARPLIASGQHPFERVKSDASELNSGEIYEILTPFPPAPMIEKLRALGFDDYSVQDETGLFHSFFLKK
jgi:hypothetical protein